LQLHRIPELRLNASECVNENYGVDDVIQGQGLGLIIDGFNDEELLANLFTTLRERVVAVETPPILAVLRDLDG
jgi:hypothetical protein